MEDSRSEWFYDRMAELVPAVLSLPSPNEFLATLPESKRCLFYVGGFLSQVDNGGVAEYLLGPYGDDVEHAIHFLNVIGQTEVGDALSDLYGKLPAGFHSCPPFERGRREENLFGADLNDDLEKVSKMIWERSDGAREGLVEHCQTNWR
jgi:hypothetical protein